jgi:chromosome segregation protein
MKLEKIVLNGFKSFADKTEFGFDSSITGIVGPNGCGKSNIVDAVKWVLGEQSVKSLRSGQMADVIFSGSSSRKGIGAAEVTLCFSNTTGKLAIETDQVQISRKIYKSGESQYCINNKICRLKDIRELFMDTGIGVKAYSIIEQGQIEQLLNASKTDRRVIFEEAAGISKYKAHKKEAMRKLERTEQNLLRIADILGEVQKQLRSLKHQAGKARSYLRYSQRLKELQANYYLSEYHKITTLSTQKKNQLDKLDESFAAIAAEVSKNDALMSQLGSEIIETENQFNQSNNSLISVQSKIEQHTQRIDFLKTHSRELQQRKKDADERIEKMRCRKNILESDLAGSSSELDNGEKLLVEKHDQLEELQEVINQINKDCTAVEADLEDEKSGIIDIVRRTAQLHNELQSLSGYRNSLSSQKDRLFGRAKTAKTELEKFLAEKAQYHARMDDIEKVLVELRTSLEEKTGNIKQISSQLEADDSRMTQTKEKRSALSSELAILKDMEIRHEGLNNAVKTILKNRADKNAFEYVETILADIISAEMEYATAVEAALEGKTDTIVISSNKNLLAAKESFEQLQSRVGFISADVSEPFVDNIDLSEFPAVKARVVEFVKYPSRYAPLAWKLLGKTILVDSIDNAVQLADRLPGDYKYVTMDGQFFDPAGQIKLGPLGKSTGLISRKSRLRQLQLSLTEITEQLSSLESQIETNKQKKIHLEKLCSNLRTAIYEANAEKTQANSRLDACEQNINRLKQEQPLITGEIDLLEQQISQSVQKEYDSRQKLAEVEAVDKEHNARIEQLEKDYACQKQLQQEKLTQLTELKVTLGQITEQNKAMKQTISGLKTQIQENSLSAQAALTETQNCTEQITQAQRDILSGESLVSELFVEKEKKQDNSRLLHEKAEKLLEQQKQAEHILRQKRAEQSEIEQQINQLKIELAQAQVKLQDLIERVREQLQIDLVQSYADYSEQQLDWQQVREEIDELRGRIERLGNVNIDAIDQQEELEKRNEFLAGQVSDLNKSKAQLQQLISRLNKISREKFLQTFEEVRVHFQELFRKLFGGGKADIMLEDAEDILEAGIEIIARPPGKEPRSISLLSGGEKTMTAISLVFAVFKAKPSPFCLLDEVDAALDEANNERFNLLIREFEKDSQFIIITHSKRTMSIVNLLYGVTMQIRGVSKKISVRFGDDEEEAAAVA